MDKDQNNAVKKEETPKFLIIHSRSYNCGMCNEIHEQQIGIFISHEDTKEKAIMAMMVEIPNSLIESGDNFIVTSYVGSFSVDQIETLTAH